MSEETLDPPLLPIDARTKAVAERLFGLKWALRKDSTEIIHEEWQTAPEWIHDGYMRQAIEVLAAADQAQPASADGSDYEERMRVEYRELTARAGRLRDMLQRYADGTLDFEPVCPISLLSRQLDVMDAYANLLRHRAKIEHVHLEEQTPPPNKQRTRPSGRALALPQTRLPRRRESNKCTNQPTNPNQPPPTPQQTPAKQHQRSPVCASSAAENALSATPCARDAMG